MSTKTKKSEAAAEDAPEATAPISGYNSVEPHVVQAWAEAFRPKLLELIQKVA